MKTLLLLSSFLFTFLVSMFAQDGAPDPAFGGGDGLAYQPIFQGKPSQGYGIAVQQDQKIVISGTTVGPDSNGHAFVLRYQENGDLDNSFNGSGIIVVDQPIHSSSAAVKIQPDGRILMGGDYSDSTGQYVAIFRFTQNGVPDNTLDGDGRASAFINNKYMDISTMALQQDGKILLGGYASRGDEADSFLVVRFLSNGTLDQSFDGDGIAITGVGEDYTDVNSLVVQPDGKILATGYATFNGNEDFTVVRYNANGTLDHTFSGDGIAHVTVSDHDDRVYSALIQPDSKIVDGGFGHNNITGKRSFAIARLNHDGTPDNSFHGDGIAVLHITDYSDQAFSILRQPDGKYVLGGSVNAGNPSFGFVMALARITEDGVLDHTFDGDGFYIYPLNNSFESQINACTLQSDGKIVSTGNFRVGPLNQVMAFRTLTGLSTSNQGVDQFIKEVTIYPNPVTDNMVLKYSLDQKEKISISICDIMGNTIDQLLNRTERNSGNHEEHLSLHKDLVPGSYFIMMETERGVNVIPVLKE